MPITAPTICAVMNPGTLIGAMPAKLSLNMRPKAAAGFANEVDAVNQQCRGGDALRKGAMRQAHAAPT
jgi:hypothetical protein